ncbi:NAD(P)H-binding protein [Devosia sp. 919]|uniref:NmrA family NAD(P)-binding protein n=1 Tax=Devosia sp. 919 TaxID=2726065 RepID=UPI001552A274|nr:NAD(P)H-binding protein [Devosia sp. 919]
MFKTILVAAGAGTVGQHLANRLLIAGHSVKIGTRRGGDANTVLLDYSQAPTFEAALAGTDAAYLVVPTSAEPHLLLGPFVEAAARRGIKLVLQSALGVDANDAIPLRQLERQIESSGAPYAILRPNWFLDNFHGRWHPGIMELGRLALPAGDATTSLIDARDIAEAAAVALTQAVADGRAFNLTGPDSLGYAEAAAALSAISGRTVTYEGVDEAQFKRESGRMKLAPALVEQMLPIFTATRAGHFSQVTDDFSQLTGRPGRRLVDYLADNAWRFAVPVAQNEVQRAAVSR